MCEVIHSRHCHEAKVMHCYFIIVFSSLFLSENTLSKKAKTLCMHRKPLYRRSCFITISHVSSFVWKVFSTDMNQKLQHYW